MTIETYLSDLSTFLQSNGYGTPGTDIFISGIHDAAGNAIFITPYGGQEYTNIISETINPYLIDVQFLIRNTDNETALSNAISVYKLLRNISNRDIGSTHVISITAIAPPMFILRTNSGYYQYSVNFNLFIQ